MSTSADRLRRFVAGVRRRWFATVALRALGFGAAATAIPGLAALVVYRVVRPTDGALLLLTLSAVTLSLAGLAAVVRRIRRRPDDARVARFVEERAETAGAGAMDDAIVSAVQALQLPRDDVRAPFAELVVAGALRRLEGITPASVVGRRELATAGGIAGAGLALAVFTLVATAPALSHSVQTARLRFFPQSITVEVLPGDARVVAGEPLQIRARISADGLDQSRLAPELVVRAGDEVRSVPLRRSDDGFGYAFESVDRSFRYKVTAGAVASQEYSVEALFPPRVKRIELEYRYPSFSGLSARTEEDGGDIYAPAGTRVRVRVHADKPIASAQLALSGGSTALAGSGTSVEAELVLTRDDSYRIRLQDQDGLRSADDSEYFIRLMDDRPPDVRILRPASDQGITPLEEVSIEARAEDDYGIAALELVYAVGAGKERVAAFRRDAGSETQASGSYLLAAEELKVRPGDVITYYARARDVGRGKPSRESRSDLFFLEVRPFNEEFVAAQSQAGAGGGDPQLDSLIDAQKEIISATWNIERRAAAGRSAEDMKAVAQAQAELKARAERMLSGARRRGRELVPQEEIRERPVRWQDPAFWLAGLARQVDTRQRVPGSQQRTDPVAAALDAMARAVEQLTSGRTREAIPHEMAALNGLLQLQAEIRRREVAQQQASGAGAGWGNRQSQDLSALFDKELQRQQRTNYEQRSQVQERPETRTTDDGALDRIRELARRQEELNRQQREAARLAAEERRRELERLTREQEELRREAEELSRDMARRQTSQPAGGQQAGQQSGQQSGRTGRAGEQAGRGSQSGEQASGGGAMREALEQMRQAAGELQRQDSESAARRGERAAQQLRDLESRLRGSGAEAAARDSADLQSEAQQVLQEQRRIAAEAGRLERGSDANTVDARRRLANEKERLSERVDALQRSAERLGSQPGAGADGARARDAAAQLQQGRVGERMRQSAEQMRAGQQGASAAAEEQIARSLEGVVEKLGGPSSSEARRMAELLESSRQLREKLDALEARMREAQAEGSGDSDTLRQAYEQELRRTRESLARETPAAEQRGGAGATPEHHEYSRSAPGTEAFKQDRSEWASLREDVNRALEARDAAASRRLAKSLGEMRLSAGGSERIPEQYRRLVAKYYESLGSSRK